MSRSIGSAQILETLSEAIAELVEKVSPSLVRVGSGRAGGSGIVWSSDGYVVTCSHVVERLDEAEVTFKDGQTFGAKLIGQDEYSDVALLKIDATGLKPIELGDSENVKVGQFVLAFANPFGQEPAVTSGLVTGAKRSIRSWWGSMMENVIVTDARLNPGYSGGPLVDVSGRMVGQSVAYVSSRGIVVPVNTVKPVVERLMNGGKIKRAYLGIVSHVVALPREISAQPQIQQGYGLMILSVEADSPAKKASLAIGDMILRFAGKPVASLYDLQKLLTEEAVGAPTELLILRAEKPIEITITPTEA
jgi:S1-C subfamily serine protease